MLGAEQVHSRLYFGDGNSEIILRSAFILDVCQG